MNRQKKFWPLICLLLAGISLPVTGDQPNILIIIGDDCTYNDLPLYGGENVITPSIDRLASQGLTFNKAFLSLSMCNPCRTELYTGLYPIRNGACWNHSAARTGTKSIVHYLNERGYRVGLTGKKHVVGKGGVFTPEIVDAVEGNCVSPTAKFEDAEIREFVSHDPAQPFCLIVALVVPHAPWTVGHPENFDPAKLKLPLNLADTAETRSDFAKYLAEIEVLDQQVGRTLEILDDAGHTSDTLVIFTSEQGSQFPGNKWTNWNTGVHTGLVVRWPGVVAPGKRTDAMIQYADVLPTLVEACGGDPGVGNFDGKSFVSVLKGNSDQHREFAYFMHNNVPEGPPYPIRGITDGTHHYIRNLAPGNLYIEKHVMGEAVWHQYWPSWLAATGPQNTKPINEGSVRLINRYMNRPAEELYDSVRDPYQMNNLLKDELNSQTSAETRQRLSKALDQWMAEQGDPGAAIDSEAAWRDSKTGNHFKPLPN